MNLACPKTEIHYTSPKVRELVTLVDHSSVDDSTLKQADSTKFVHIRIIKSRIIATLIGISGWTVLLTLGVLLWHLLSQVWPLLETPDAGFDLSFSLPPNEQILHVGDIINGASLATLDESCRINFYTLNAKEAEPKLNKTRVVPTLCSDKIRLSQIDGALYLAKLSPSGILRIERFAQGQQNFERQLETTFAVSTSNQTDKIDSFDFQLSKKWVMVSLQMADTSSVQVLDKRTNETILSDQILSAKHLTLLPNIGQYVYSQGKTLHSYNVATEQKNETSMPLDIDFLSAFPGQRSLLTQFSDGKIQKWSIVNQQGNLKFEPLYVTQPLAELYQVNFHQVENAALLLTKTNELHFFNHVTAEMVSVTNLEQEITNTILHNRLLYVVLENHIDIAQITGLQGVNTFEAFWGENRYEGYAAKDYVWQTTSASNYHETKFSVVPLVIGSLKASFLALLIAVPLALSAAIYTAYFAPAKLRNWMKPSIEILEAIPSVVLGFIAAIWLAPLAEQFIVSLVLFVLLIPFVLLVFALIHQPLLDLLPNRFKEGWELPVIALLLLIDAGFVSFITTSAVTNSSGLIAEILIPNDVFANMNKSTLVVALALGIAVVPSIYSLAEDAIYDVPTSLKQASLALGATRLQTLRRVVLVLAYPGILSAIALGLGRAFGETMIVLMVTGNTPVAEWDLLAGLRTLTANLAIELPESEVASSHYQVLFLTALVLFAFTFLLNSLAEILRQWLRKNYRHG